MTIVMTMTMMTGTKMIFFNRFFLKKNCSQVVVVTMKIRNHQNTNNNNNNRQRQMPTATTTTTIWRKSIRLRRLQRKHHRHLVRHHWHHRRRCRMPLQQYMHSKRALANMVSFELDHFVWLFLTFEKVSHRNRRVHCRLQLLFPLHHLVTYTYFVCLLPLFGLTCWY